jgi:hypothetical protein
MTLATSSCCVLNSGNGAWAFEGLARQLAAALWVDVSAVPRQYNYLLFAEAAELPPNCNFFISLKAIELASDKRLLADVFSRDEVPTPETHLIDTLEEVHRFAASRAEKEWCVKYPLGCGASGHRLFTAALTLPHDWPRPYLVQEFIRLERPEVYRTYAAGGELFGWVARRFPPEARPSPWVAHARGARYEQSGAAPAAALAPARSALVATGLLGSFGCVDLLRKPSGEWVVLEVGTDGLVNHVDRDLGDPEFERETQRRIAEAFWARIGVPPWEPGEWRPGPSSTAREHLETA